MGDPTMPAVERNLPEPTRVDRAPGGRFAPGNKLGRGRPGSRTEALKNELLDWLEDFDKSLDRSRFEALCQRAYSQAMSGDKEMLRFLLSQCVGKPVAQILANYNVNRNTLLSVADRRDVILARLAELQGKMPAIPAYPQLSTDIEVPSSESAPVARE